eukprot:2331240-Pyramimonas_sp.AAC.1
MSGGRLVMGRADSTGEGVVESSAGVAVSSFVPVLARDVPTHLRRDLPGSRCQVAVINTGLRVPVYVSRCT